MVILLIILILLVPKTETVTFHNNPGTVHLNENDDSGMTLWSISATCYPSTNRWGLGGLSGTIRHAVDCQTCVWETNQYPGLFSISGKTVSKSSCSETSCGNCPSCSTCSTSNGCMSSGIYSIAVNCYTTSYDNDDSGTSTLTISVLQEATLTISLADTLSADNSMAVGTVLAIAGKSSGQPIVEYTKPTAVENSYLLGTANMFELNTGYGQVYVRTDPAVEYDYTYTMRVCIHSRRRESCKTITITFDGCFQTPNCNDQSDTTSFSDQFPTGGTLFTMTSDTPSAHFSSISSTWQNLNFVITSSTLAEASLDRNTGVITTTGNITVWPDYPYATHTIVVTVTNPGQSCHYSATCTMSMQIQFTNWPIRITNLPTRVIHHEDDDERSKMITIITYDYNNPAHDTVTCEVVTNDEPTLLELVHDDGKFEYNSWSIYKKRCQDPDCGYIDANFLCTEKIGCLNYDLDNEYTITVKCKDAYGTDDTETITLKVTENQPPLFTNTPALVYKTDVQTLETVYTIYYKDQETEDLKFNFTVSPSTPSVFAFNTRGNYSNNPAKIYMAFLDSERTSINGTYFIAFCGSDRRNMVCSNLTINITLKDEMTFNNPGILFLSENDDSETILWNISAICFPSTNTYYLGKKTGENCHRVSCEACTIASDPDSRLFFLSGHTVYKSTCLATRCGNCPSCTPCSASDGCLRGPATYDIVIECYTQSYDNNDNETSTLTVNITRESPALSISLPDTVNASNSMSAGTVLATASKSSGPVVLEYTKSSSVANTYSRGTLNMFELDTENGQVYVATDPALEYDNTYSIEVCIHSRRQVSCSNMTINFDGCFQTPNCRDQSDITQFSDQFPIGGTLFTMIYDPPSGHFSTLSLNWQNLKFRIVASTLDDVSLDGETGTLTTTYNITVWPDYPYSTHTVVVQVSNPGHSCSYTSTCTMSMRFAFTNWPIFITSLPTSNSILEDMDERTLVHSILIADKNNPDHDNVTCEIVNNSDSSLLELHHDGHFGYRSWFIYKKKCQDPSCGYIQENFLCKTGIGCMNYDLESRYNITVQCNDAYGSSDTELFMLNVDENHAPVFTNTPTSIVKQEVDNLETVYSIYYIDQEKEDLVYNFTVSPSTRSVFAFDTHGNYHNNPAKITLDFLDTEREFVNGTYFISFCGSDRRNIVCSNLTINITLKESDANSENEMFPMLWVVIVIGLALVCLSVTIVLCVVVRRKSNREEGVDASRVNDRPIQRTNNPSSNNMNNEYDEIELQDQYDQIQHNTQNEASSGDMSFQRVDGEVYVNTERGTGDRNDNVERERASDGYMVPVNNANMTTGNTHGRQNIAGNGAVLRDDIESKYDSIGTSNVYIHPIDNN